MSYDALFLFGYLVDRAEGFLDGAAVFIATKSLIEDLEVNINLVVDVKISLILHFLLINLLGECEGRGIRDSLRC